MPGKRKYGKFLIVLFLTLLIWVWADLQKTETFALTNAAVNVAQSTNANLWVTLEKGSSVNLERIVLKGPASRIDKLKRWIRAGDKLEFEFDAVQENMDDSGNYTLNLLSFLSKHKQLEETGLKVESCIPRKISVTVHKLTEKILPVACFDENKNPITAKIVPPQVKIMVPEDIEGVAGVQLGTAEIKQARASSVQQIPFFELPDGRIIKSNSSVALILIGAPRISGRLSILTSNLPSKV